MALSPDSNGDFEKGKNALLEAILERAIKAITESEGSKEEVQKYASQILDLIDTTDPSLSLTASNYIAQIQGVINK